jgi:hypothetical protein
MPLEEFTTRICGTFVGQDGARYERIPHRVYLLGKGMRDACGTKEEVAVKCRTHEEKYRQLVKKYRREKTISIPLTRTISIC